MRDIWEQDILIREFKKIKELEEGKMGKVYLVKYKYNSNKREVII